MCLKLKLLVNDKSARENYDKIEYVENSWSQARQAWAKSCVALCRLYVDRKLRKWVQYVPSKPGWPLQKHAHYRVFFWLDSLRKLLQKTMQQKENY